MIIRNYENYLLVLIRESSQHTSRSSDGVMPNSRRRGGGGGGGQDSFLSVRPPGSSARKSVSLMGQAATATTGGLGGELSTRRGASRRCTSGRGGASAPADAPGAPAPPAEEWRPFGAPGTPERARPQAPLAARRSGPGPVTCRPLVGIGVPQKEALPSAASLCVPSPPPHRWRRRFLGPAGPPRQRPPWPCSGPRA